MQFKYSIPHELWKAVFRNPFGLIKIAIKDPDYSTRRIERSQWAGKNWRFERSFREKANRYICKQYSQYLTCIDTGQIRSDRVPFLQLFTLYGCIWYPKMLEVNGQPFGDIYFVKMQMMWYFSLTNWSEVWKPWMCTLDHFYRRTYVCACAKLASKNCSEIQYIFSINIFSRSRDSLVMVHGLIFNSSEYNIITIQSKHSDTAPRRPHFTSPTKSLTMHKKEVCTRSYPC